MREWQQTTIGDILALEYGAALPESRRSGSGFPVVGSSGIVGHHEVYMVEGPGIVVGRKGSIGSITWVDESFTPIDTSYYVNPDRGADPRYLFWLLQTAGLSRMDASTGVPGLNRNDAYRVPIQVPPPLEQRKIADILDTADAAIRHTEATIAKLRQMKQGLLHDLLTRGIDDNGELRDPVRHPEQFRDSPLGRIPKGWEIDAIGPVSDFVTSGSRGWARFYAEQGSRFIRIANLSRTSIRFTNAPFQHVRPDAGAEGERTQVQPGDLLLSITADLGRVGVAPEGLGDAFVNQHLALARISSGKANPKWVAWYLLGERGQRGFRVLDDPGAKAGLNLPTVRALQFAKPSQAEQGEIVARLTSIEDGIDLEAAELHSTLNLKQGLMDDLLTGRVRVTV